MGRYFLRWGDVAEDAYKKLPGTQQRAVDKRMAQLAENPKDGSSYDPTTDRWTTTADSGSIMIVFALHDNTLRITILRLV
ncbi:type II toxin-antitoxin system RelE family toxin [Actinopolyspora mortivallis]|uniref:Addiction module toxin RelE n=1 Tax=Actinopolyspora mortivallis TaxID=33906 RepID=A0A2T0GST8_ACTMO|nr:hypothetical protein [Actinopolyspora mortivallis]PRW62182.1 hypothetical protein CEP50_16770 [Actinopolyspora mortivallis]PRW62228.1 hypothetical protein CEP50_16630 [Actinopolyspora mortivallis]